MVSLDFKPNIKVIAIILLLVVVLGVVGYYFYSVYALGQEGDIGSIIQITLMYALAFGLVFFVLYAIGYWVYNTFFKKKELYMTAESFKNVKQTLLLNPYDKGARLLCVGKEGLGTRHYGTIIGIGQRPVPFERKYDMKERKYSETAREFELRRKEYEEAGVDKWTFVLFRPENKPVWRIPLLKAFAPLEILRVYPRHHSELVGDVRVFDTNIEKIGKYFYPASYMKYPSIILNAEMSDSMIYANLYQLDYITLVAQRGIEGDTSLQKFLLSKSDTIRTTPFTGGEGQ